MSCSAASSAVLLGCAQRIGLSNQPGSAASCGEAPNAELAAAATAPCRTFRLVTMNLPADRFYDFSGALAQCVQSPYVAFTAVAGGDAPLPDLGCGSREWESDRSRDRARRRSLGGEQRREKPGEFCNSTRAP